MGLAEDFSRQRRRGHRRRARKIAEKAQAEGRDFTPAERTKVAEAVTEAKALEGQDCRGQRRLRATRPDREVRQGPLHEGDRRASRVDDAPGTVGSRAFDRAGFKDSSISPSGSLDVPSLVAGIAGISDAPRNLLQLVPSSGLGQSAFRFVRETVHEQNAASVKLGAAKPKSVYELQPIDERARVVAHLSPPIDNTTFSDSADVGTFIDSVMRSGLALAVEAMILHGDASDPDHDDFDGLNRISGTRSQMWDTDLFRTVRKALLTLEATSKLQGPFTVVMSPTHWAEAELVQSEQRYVLADPGTGGRTLPLDAVVAHCGVARSSRASRSKTQTNASSVSSPRDAIEIFERETATVMWSEAVLNDGVDVFSRNQKVWRAECRIGLACKKPFAFNIVSLSGHQGS